MGWTIRFGTPAEYEMDHRFHLNEREEELYVQLHRSLKQQGGHATIGEKDVHKQLVRLCEKRNLPLPLARADTLCRLAHMNLAGYGVLEPLLQDPSLEEIAVLGAKEPLRVYVKGKGWKRTNACFLSEEGIVDTANKMARALGRRLSFHTPRLDAVLPNGDRLHAVLPPLTLENTVLTIRKFKEKPYAIPELVGNHTLSAEAASFFWLALQSDLNLLIAGNTGSGKTTLLNALLVFVPFNERILVVEETPEIRVLHPHQIKLVASPESQVSMQQLVHDTLRMRPDRVLVGEVRTEEETRALFEALSAGQAKGTYATFHARTAKEALHRLQSLGIPPYELDSMDVLVVLRRQSVYDEGKKQWKETRRVTEVAEVAEQKVRPLFEWDPPSQKLAAANMQAKGKSEVVRRLQHALGISATELFAEIERRKRFLERLAREKRGYEETAQAIQAYAP